MPDPNAPSINNINTVTTNNNLNISEKIEKISGLKHINTIDKPIDISLEKRNIEKSEFWEHILSKFFNETDEQMKFEVIRTLNFLNSKMENLFPILEEKFWISKKYFLEKIFERLSDQLKEAQNSGRKFTNWTVVSLKKIEENGNFIIEEIPYFAFGSTNVSLDKIFFEINWKNTSLRKILEIIWLKDNKTWEFFLPNSLWVSVMILLKDGNIVCQERNNKATLTNYNGLTASASWAVNLDGNTWWPEILKANAVKEVSEELWINSTPAQFFPNIENIKKSIQEHILWELNIDGNSWVMVPTGVIMERKRHNPEVVFTLFLDENYNMDIIKQKWENAADKWESIDLVWKSIESIENDINFYINNLSKKELESATWLEDFIWKQKNNTLAWPHLLMSYLAYSKATEKKIKQIWNNLTWAIENIMQK